eukprot:6175166-Pleurochrysis_carterae.AAC.2
MQGVGMVALAQSYSFPDTPPNSEFLQVITVSCSRCRLAADHCSSQRQPGRHAGDPGHRDENRDEAQESKNKQTPLLKLVIVKPPPVQKAKRKTRHTPPACCRKNFLSCETVRCTPSPPDGTPPGSSTGRRGRYGAASHRFTQLSSITSKFTP